MKAALFHDYSGPTAIVLGDAPVPDPGPGEVRIAMRAAALNNSDLQSTHGGYGRPALPHTVGGEGAGVVDAVGEGVTNVQPGDRVLGRVRKACAEYSIAAAHEVLPFPDSISFEVAASLPIAYLTAAMGIVHKARLQAGQWMLVNPGTGAVGSAAIQLGQALGAHVLGTAGSDEKAERLKALGARHVVNYVDGDVGAAARELTDGQGVHLALDGGGTVTFAQCLDALRSNGAIAVYGYVTGNEAALPITKLLLKNASIYGYAIWTNQDYLATIETLRTLVLPMVADGRIQSVVDVTLPLDRTGDALQQIADRRVAGKVVITIP